MAEQLVLTWNPATHEVAMIERVGKDGRRGLLSEHECEQLLGEDDVDEFLGPVQEAYEAGLAEGLEEQSDEDRGDDEIMLWQLLSNERAGGRLLPTGLRWAMLRRLLLRQLLRKRVSHTPNGSDQRRKPIPEKSRNGSASDASAVRVASYDARTEHLKRRDNMQGVN